MDSGLSAKIEKAIQYAQEPDRFEFQQIHVTVRGSHTTHAVDFNSGAWKCDCEFFITHKQCSHTIAVEKVLGYMLPGAIPMLPH
jgi:hypothetical protein